MNPLNILIQYPVRTLGVLACLIIPRAADAIQEEIRMHHQPAARPAISRPLPNTRATLVEWTERDDGSQTIHIPLDVLQLTPEFRALDPSAQSIMTYCISEANDRGYTHEDHYIWTYAKCLVDTTDAVTASSASQ